MCVRQKKLQGSKGMKASKSESRGVLHTYMTLQLILKYSNKIQSNCLFHPTTHVHAALGLICFSTFVCKGVFELTEPDKKTVCGLRSYSMCLNSSSWWFSLFRHDGIKPGNLTVMTPGSCTKKYELNQAELTPFNLDHCTRSFHLADGWKLILLLSAAELWDNEILHPIPACTERTSGSETCKGVLVHHWSYTVKLKFRVESTWWIWTRLMF